MAAQCSGNRGDLHFPCRDCSSGGHVTAMCPGGKSLVGSAAYNSTVANNKKTIVDVCFSSGLTQSPQLLPIIRIRLRGHNGDNCYFNFLFDTGSQRSYLSNSALELLNCNNKLIATVEY